MKVFDRRSGWDRFLDAAINQASAVAHGGVGRFAKIGAGVAGSLLTATAASAVVSSLRNHGNGDDQKDGT